MDSSGLTLYWTICVKTMTRLQSNCDSGIFDWILVPLLLVFDGIAVLGEDFVGMLILIIQSSKSKVRKMPSSYLKVWETGQCWKVEAVWNSYSPWWHLKCLSFIMKFFFQQCTEAETSIVLFFHNYHWYLSGNTNQNKKSQFSRAIN